MNRIEKKRHFAKPNNVRAAAVFRAAPRARIVRAQIAANLLDRLATRRLATRFQQLAVHVQNRATAAAFVQVVDILRDEGERAPRRARARFEFGERDMRRVGADGLQCFAPLVIKALDEPRIAREPFGRSDILDAMLFPQAVGGAKSAKPRFGRDPGAG